MSNVIRVAGVQHSRVVGDKEGNLTAIATWVERAAAEGARIVALPELSNTGYICTSTDEAYFALAEEIPGPTAQFYEKLARDYDITVVGGLFERDSVSPIYYNGSAVAASSGLVGHYRKTHIPAQRLARCLSH